MYDYWQRGNASLLQWKYFFNNQHYVPESSYVEIHYSNVNYVGEGKII